MLGSLGEIRLLSHPSCVRMRLFGGPPGAAVLPLTKEKTHPMTRCRILGVCAKKRRREEEGRDQQNESRGARADWLGPFRGEYGRWSIDLPDHFDGRWLVPHRPPGGPHGPAHIGPSYAMRVSGPIARSARCPSSFKLSVLSAVPGRSRSQIRPEL